MLATILLGSVLVFLLVGFTLMFCPPSAWIGRRDRER